MTDEKKKYQTKSVKTKAEFEEKLQTLDTKGEQVEVLEEAISNIEERTEDYSVTPEMKEREEKVNSLKNARKNWEKSQKES